MAVSAFSFSLHVLKNGSLAELKGKKAGPELPDPNDKTKKIAADQTLIESVKTFATGEIAMLPDKFNAALVICTGELDREGGRSLSQITVIGETIHE